MGCDCNKQRDKAEDYNTKESLERCLIRSGKFMHSKSSTANDTDLLTMEVIRVITEPLSTSYCIDSFLKEKRQTSMFTAKYLPTEQPCSIKFIAKAFGRALIHQKAKLSLEWQRISKLDHPGVLRTYEVMQDEKYFYVVSESFPGGQLDDYLSDPRFAKESTAAKIMYQVLRALVYCHSNGFIHGRLTPKSLVLSDKQVTDNLKVKLTGFGELDTIPCESRKGDDAYKAPEIHLGFNEKCDIWSCGVILSIILSDEVPFKKPTQNRLRRCSTVFSPNVWRSKSEGAVALIAAMLQKDPQNRPTAAQCLANPWIQTHVFSGQLKSTMFNYCLTGIRRLSARNPLQEAILKFITLRMLNEKDLDGLTAAFFHFDKDGDGKLNEEELRTHLGKAMTLEEASAAAKKVIEAAEQNGSSAVTYTEFLISSFSEKKLLSPDNLQKAFSCFDKDSRGRISLETLKSSFFVRGDAEKERQWRQLLLTVNGAGEDEISFAEFAALISHSGRI